jgi:hypothetical protein
MIGAVEPNGVTWSQQQTTLWTGRRNGMPLGTIERGRRFTYTDVDGAAQRGFRTLAAAQQAHLVATMPAAIGWRQSAVERSLMIASTGAALATVALIAVAAPLMRGAF